MGSKTNSKSPFFIQQEFLSPLLCDQILDNIANVFPALIDIGEQQSSPSAIHCIEQESQDIIVDRFERLVPLIDAHFNVVVNNLTQIKFMWYPENYNHQKVVCDNSQYIDKKWVKTKKRDLSATLFLSSYCDKTPLDFDYEVYGGKVEYPQYNFGFQPEQGTLIIHPSDPHFLHCVGPVHAGELIMAKFYLTVEGVYVYNPEDFPGSYKTWFSSLT